MNNPPAAHTKGFRIPAYDRIVTFLHKNKENTVLGPPFLSLFLEPPRRRKMTVDGEKLPVSERDYLLYRETIALDPARDL